MSDLPQAAAEYAAQGLPVFRLSPNAKIPLAHTKGFRDATTDADTVAQWWGDREDCNIGIATGKAAGFFVIDLDGPDGVESLEALEQELGPLSATRQQMTGSGGYHMLFKWPASFPREIRNKQALRPGVDIRGEGGYIVGAPSIHPNGKQYKMGTGTIAECPQAWLDFICPAPAVPIWEQPARPAPVRTVTQTPVTERAALYLDQCAPATQGQGGHNALLWAARAMVVGFELSQTDALALLWQHFNQRCTPPWDQGNPADVRDFERKVAEVAKTPGTKPRGWLLDECGLRTLDQAFSGTERANAAKGIDNLMAKMANHGRTPDDPEDPAEDRTHFPMHLFPPEVAAYAKAVAGSHVVDPSFAALPIIGCAAAAIGNAWRLKLKAGFSVPPTLWIGLVANSGTNKSGPMAEIVKPLHRPLTGDDIVSDPNVPDSRRVVLSDATMEAVIQRMHENPRGVLVFRDELAAWVKGFNAYRKGGGGDEQAWLEFWAAGAYTLDRKSNDEEVLIPHASACVMGGIQPQIMAECFDPSKFASGLVPRILICAPPPLLSSWSETEVTEAQTKMWTEVVTYLRTRPFAGVDTASGKHIPQILTLAPGAKKAYVTYYNEIAHAIDAADNDNSRSLISKSRIMAARLALAHRALWLATEGGSENEPLPVASMEAGIEWARWCLAEQMRVYGFKKSEDAREAGQALADKVKAKHGMDWVCPSQVTRLNNRKYKKAAIAREAMAQMVDAGLAEWDAQKEKVRLT